MLVQHLAEKIISEVRKLLDEDIILTDTNGIIIASTDPKRIRQFHEGAKIASEKKTKLIITEKDTYVLQGVKAGINLPIFFQRNVVGVIGITGKPEKVSPFGEIIRKMTELLISENYFTEQFDWQSRSIESFLLDWIQLHEWSDDFLNRAKLLNIDLLTDRQVIIGEVNRDSSILYRELWLSIMSWNEKNKNDIISRWGNNRIIYVAAIDKEDHAYIQTKAKAFQQFLHNRLKSNVSLGVGSKVPSFKLKQSFHQAERALKACKSDHDIIFDKDLTLEMILDDIKQSTKTEFLKRTINPLLQEKELLQTIKSFLENDGSLKETAESLHIHINTLHYRFKKIKEMTKLDPKSIQGLMIFYLAYRLLDNHTKM